MQSVQGATSTGELYDLRPMTPDIAGYSDLVQESMAEGHRMLHRLRENWLIGRNTFDRPGEVLVCALHAGKLVGVCGRNIDPYDSEPRAGRVRHLYVSAANRRQGVGGLLLRQVTNNACQFFDFLNALAPVEAFGFYERLGFTRVENVEAVTHRLMLCSINRPW
jgi:N-acetylglutamate synthase-like GNAT family acetyltransferase